MDEARLANAVREILLAIGEDPDRAELRETPTRAAGMYAELFGGGNVDPRQFLADPLPYDHRELIALRDISVRSMCEHHLVPMVGVAHIAYIPNGRIVGLSKLPRLVEVFARRLQVQERLTEQIASALMRVLEPQGVAVVVEAAHLCMMMRGVEKQNSKTITSAVKGVFREDLRTREEFLRLCMVNGVLG
jgi:GTP cyclohydrolase IA